MRCELRVNAVRKRSVCVCAVRRVCVQCAVARCLVVLQVGLHLGHLESSVQRLFARPPCRRRIRTVGQDDVSENHREAHAWNVDVLPALNFAWLGGLSNSKQRSGERRARMAEEGG